MPDEVQKTFVRSFVLYLKKQIELQTYPADAQESVEVAVQCLEAAYDLGEDDNQQAGTQSSDSAAGETAKIVNAKDIDLFELFQSVYIERNPESLQMAETIKNEGNRLMKDGKYYEALLQYNRAITFDPKNPIFYCNRAAAYIRLGDNEHAVTDCKTALQYNQDYGKAYGRLGIAYSNLGKFEEAQQAYTKAIALEPENQDYRNNLEVARNARSHHGEPSIASIPQLTEGLNAMLSNPTIRNLFTSAEIDLEQLQNLSQNPMIMNVIGQMFTGAQGGGGAGAGGGIGIGGAGQIPPMPTDMMQLFQTFANQLNTMSNNRGGDGSGNGNNTGGQQQQQPPPSS